MTWTRKFILASLLALKVLATLHCTADQTCWPSADVWSAFNASLNGRLVAPRPPGWVCHDPNYDEVACNNVKINWNSSFWRANQTGAMQNPVWDSLGCGIDSPRNVTCDQGFVPHYSVDARTVGHVSQAVMFADKYNISLVVKNTGHDFLGRSSAKGSFGIWTHNLKGINFTGFFVPSGCLRNETAPAVTVGAAEQWLDVYKAANERNVSVVGGAARSVGAAGGWVQGGGHSPLGALFGMGVDNVLEFTVVKPNGQIVKANKCQNQDLFWALRGGGGGTWGVTLDVTYKTYPPVNANVRSFSKRSPGSLIKASEGTAPGNLPSTLMVLWIHPNSTSLQATNSTLQPIYNWTNANNGTQVQLITSTHRTFYDMFSTYIQDESIGVPIWFGTRLVSRSAFANNSKELVKYIWGDGLRLGTSFNIIGGGAISKVDPESTALNPQWRKDAIVSWTFGGSWAANASTAEIEAVKGNTTQIIQKFGKVAGLDDAAYFNEADPLEPQWKKSFFGSHYDRLLKIKQQVDPKGLFTCNRCLYLIEMHNSPTRRGETENATEQKEQELSLNVVQGLRNEFEQLFKSKSWRGVHNLPKSSNRRALVIAISYGERRPPHRLYGTFVDALRIIRMLERFNYQQTDICVLADIVIPDCVDDLESDTSEIDDSESRLPKKVNILRGLKWLASGTGEGQYRFLFFSGHGHYQPYKPSPTSNQCIMPEDVKFQRLNSCTDCVCSENVWRASDQTGEPLLVPEPFSVLWDHIINQRLSGSLRSGTKFTAVFDCCYSGGMLETALQDGPGEEIITSSQPNSKGRRHYGLSGPTTPVARVSPQESSLGHVPPLQEDVIMADPPAKQTQPSESLDFAQASQSPGLVSRGALLPQQFAGNFLGLPIEIDLVTGTESFMPQPRNMDFIQPKRDKTQNLKQITQDPLKPNNKTIFAYPEIWTTWARSQSSAPPAEASQSVSEFTCQRPGIFSNISSFEQGCKIICWAACRKVESALEDRRNAGRFTEAFTEFLTRPTSSEETQLPRSTEVLISHLRVKFGDYNKEARKNKWAEQHPKIFISNGVPVDQPWTVSLESWTTITCILAFHLVAATLTSS
ncbi:hypothetical protein OPQ81_002179 [Rhizoctonia solani]|nr:hypothetical protein OPQ81_002179 [Rhizoctonia solani]